MPAKRKHDDKTPTPVPDDPNILALREAQEKKNAELRAAFENEELTVRRRIEAMEDVDLRFVLADRDRRMDPESYKARTTQKGPLQLHVKLLTGNRAIPQQNFDISLPEPDVSLLLLKVLIRDEAMRKGQSADRFAPSNQRLFAFGKDIFASDEQRTGIKSLGIFPGTCLQMALAAGNATSVPPQVTRQRAKVNPSPALSPVK
eukprot:GILI01027415.1.p1 GENE.GILI01027415.1~~GILI01027415.1.p1  ORF type:complete len:215 (+),score=30.65 GILI01027415.1:38-646(+)